MFFCLTWIRCISMRQNQKKKTHSAIGYPKYYLFTSNVWVGHFALHLYPQSWFLQWWTAKLTLQYEAWWYIILSSCILKPRMWWWHKVRDLAVIFCCHLWWVPCILQEKIKINTAEFFSLKKKVYSTPVRVWKIGLCIYLFICIVSVSCTVIDTVSTSGIL